MSKLAITLGASLLVAAVHGQEIGYPQLDPESLYLKTATTVLVIGKPEMVAAPNARVYGLSPEGRYALLTWNTPGTSETEALVTQSLRVLDTRSGGLLEVTTFRKGLFLEDHCFGPTASSALVSTISYPPDHDLLDNWEALDSENAIQHVMRLDLVTGRWEEVARFPRFADGFQQWATLIGNPAGATPVILLNRRARHTRDAERVVFVLDRYGRPAMEVKLPANTHIRRQGWSADGKQLYLEAMVIPPTPPKPDDPPRRYKGLRVDCDKGTYEWSETPLDPYEPPKKSDSVRLSRVQHPVTNGAGKAQVPGLWLSAVGVSDQPPILVSTMGEDEDLSPDLSFIAYTHGGAIFLRRITEMSQEEYAKALIGEEIRKAISNAKQTALGFIMYATDHDDVLPPTQNWLAAIMPYLRNSEVTDGFVFTLGGVNMTQMASIYEPPLGYVDTPWGRIIVHADTSIKWEPKPGTL